MIREIPRRTCAVICMTNYPECLVLPAAAGNRAFKLNIRRLLSMYTAAKKAYNRAYANGEKRSAINYADE